MIEFKQQSEEKPLIVYKILNKGSLRDQLSRTA